MIIETKDLQEHFRINDKLNIKAVDGVSFGIQEGEVFGLVGESGCGKSTVARCLSGIYKPTGGEIMYDGAVVTGTKRDKEAVKHMQREVQLIFQDSQAALNPRMSVEQLVKEPAKIHKDILTPQVAEERFVELMDKVGITPDMFSKKPSELSGGQRQRVAIARSLMLNPRLVIADEPIASLDISIQAQIIMLFKELQEQNNFSFLFIAHDLSVVKYISDRVGVMFRGRLVELAPTQELFSNPLHEYTRSLLSSNHIPDPSIEKNRQIVYYNPDMILGENWVEVSKGHFVLK